MRNFPSWRDLVVKHEHIASSLLPFAGPDQVTDVFGHRRPPIVLQHFFLGSVDGEVTASDDRCMNLLQHLSYFVFLHHALLLSFVAFMHQDVVYGKRLSFLAQSPFGCLARILRVFLFADVS